MSPLAVELCNSHEGGPVYVRVRDRVWYSVSVRVGVRVRFKVRLGLRVSVRVGLLFVLGGRVSVNAPLWQG